MTYTKAVIFDYIGTLVDCKNYTMETSKERLYAVLVEEGFEVAKENFLKAYVEAHEKYRKIRYEQLREVSNEVWVAEALSNLGFKVTADDCRVKAALAVFFKDYIDMLGLRRGAKQLIKLAKAQCKVGLISNFTHAPVIYSSLRKVGINSFFNAVVVSQENGWRKPSGHIFKETLSRLRVDGNEALFIGDSPIEDIKGAKEAGLKTVFVPSQFYSYKDLHESQQEPDFIEEDLESISLNFPELTSF